MNNKKMHVFMFIDALGWEQVVKYEFMKTEFPFRKSIEMQFGYSCTAIPTILTGKRPDVHGHLSFYTYAPKKSPFKALRFLHPFLRPRSLFDRGRVRNVLSKIIKKFYGFTGYFQLYLMPLDKIGKMDYCEKKDLFVVGGLSPCRNLADELSETDLTWHISNWRLSEKENIHVAMSLLKENKTDFYFIYTAAFDALQHDCVGNDEILKAKLRVYENEIRKLLDVAKESGRDFSFTIISDHGMTPLRGTADIAAAIKETKLVFDKDYAVCLDSTMAHFHFLTPNAKEIIEEKLNSDKFPGHWLTDEEEIYYGIKRADNMFGDAIFLMNPGIQIIPSDMGRKPLNGMHGFSPADKDSNAAILSTAPIPDAITRVCDYYSLMSLRIHELTDMKEDQK